MNSLFRVSLAALLSLSCLIAYGDKAGAEPTSANQAERSKLVPTRKLELLHAPEVHRELELSSEQIDSLENLFQEIDGIWFRSRLLPFPQQRQTVLDLQQRVDRWFQEKASASQRERLWQLEFQAQGTRGLLRPDVASKLGLREPQTQRLLTAARKAVEAQQALQAATRTGKESQELTDTYQKAVKREHAESQAILEPDQQRKLASLIGAPFDTSKLRRIYPMAPEFAEVTHWINSDPLTLQQLRGKVVLIHFYAFQCHNCHANFEHYRRWHEQSSDDEVVVIGIQTPETRMERNVDAIRQAAAERELRFPILVDLESKNWDAWANTMWPTIYVVDRDGYIRFWWQGELNWKGATVDQQIDTLIAELLAEK